MMSSRAMTMFSVAALLFIGGLLIENAEAACSTVSNCIDCGSPETGVCKSCARFNGLEYANPTSTVCTACNSGTNNCSECINVKNCTKCTDLLKYGPDYGLGSCSACSAHCKRCPVAGGGKCDTCLPGYILDSGSMQCVACSANCSNCDISKSDKCDVCVDGYGLHTDTRLCDKCADGCAMCAKNISQCTRCLNGTAPMVPEMDGTGKCGACADHCANCTAAGARQCDMCVAGYELMTVEGMTTCKSTSTCEIIERSIWTKRVLPGSVVSRMGPYMTIIFHMTSTDPCTTDALCNQRIKAIEDFQMNSGSQSCIAYNLLIGENGKIYAGRGVDMVGNVTAGWDDKAINVAVVGTFTSRDPNQAAKDAIAKLLGPDCRTFLNVDTAYKFYNHFDVGCTRCPGKNLRTWLEAKYGENYGGYKGTCPKEGRGFPRPMK